MATNGTHLLGFSRKTLAHGRGLSQPLRHLCNPKVNDEPFERVHSAGTAKPSLCQASHLCLFLQVSFRSSTKIADGKLSIILGWWVQFVDLLLCPLLTPDMTGEMGLLPRGCTDTAQSGLRMQRQRQS